MSEQREKELIQLFHAQHIDQIYDNAIAISREAMIQAGEIDPEHLETFDEFVEELKRIAFNTSIEILAKNYTDEEVRFLIEYSTHPMQLQISKKSPVVMAELISQLNTLLHEKEEEMLRRFRK